LEATIFTVPGRPVPKGRPRFTKHGGVYTPKRTKEYEELVGWSYRTVQKSRYDGLVEVSIRLIYRSKKRLPDIDNVAKSILDGLNGAAWDDDKCVASLHVGWEVRANEDERAEVVIRPLEKAS